MKLVITAIVLISGLMSTQARLPEHWQDLGSLRFAETPVFECREVGLFQHPNTCTQFIQCNAELVAIEKDCPPCVDESRCLDTKLHYNDEKKTCELPRSDVCPSWPTTTSATTTTTTTTTTTPPSPTTVSPQIPCKPNCTITGYCACYDICIEDSSSPLGGYTLKQFCDRNLYWNPDAVSSSAHGGSCDFWTNLSPELQAEYRDPLKCDTPKEPCEWKEDDKCDNKYFYRPEADFYVEFQHLQCPESPVNQPPLYWNQNTKTCGFDCPQSPNPCTYCR